MTEMYGPGQQDIYVRCPIYERLNVICMFSSVIIAVYLYVWCYLFCLLICDVGLCHLTVVRLILYLLTVLDYIG